jgi:hypothetical protein
MTTNRSSFFGHSDADYGVYVVGGTWDTLNMMAFYDAAVISIMLVYFLLTIVTMNEETQYVHLQILEGQRYQST